MKKLLALLLAALMIAALTACSDKDANKEDLKDYLQQEVVVDKAQIGDAVYHFDNVDSETVTITGYESVDTPHEVVIPAELDGKAVVAISAEAFYYHSNVKAIKLPDTVKSIGDFAFAGCAMLESLTIPANVEEIGEGAFAECTAMETLTFASGSKLTEIPKSAFTKCTALTAVTIPASVKMVGTGAFLGCSALAEITVAEGVEMIGSQAFQNCVALATLKLPASVVTIGSQAFSGSENLYVQGVTVPADSVAAEFIAAMKLTNKPAETTPAA